MPLYPPVPPTKKNPKQATQDSVPELTQKKQKTFKSATFNTSWLTNVTPCYSKQNYPAKVMLSLQ